ncbi:MAG: hypothetical protein CMM50_11505 [Rhodospirillaceae bacterium]|nr:hypothetical protein [Rhodospirillaceae bacterium]
MTAGRVIANSIPKAGTHLLTRTLELLGLDLFPTFLNGGLQARSMEVAETPDTVRVGSEWPCLVENERFFALMSQVSEGGFIKGHLPYSSRVADMLARLRYRMVLMVRDPRDITVSHVNWALSRDYLPHQKLYQALRPEDRLSAAIVGFRCEPNGPILAGLRERLDHMLPWTEDPMCCLVRFETLVGAQGGGSREAQIAEMRRIADHLDLDLTDDRLAEAADAVFGGTLTFKSGQIGRWREAFTDRHRALVKQLAGDAIVRLGYEESDDW